MADTKIQWATKVWNPVTGCTKVSSGCKHCYAERLFERFENKWGYGFNDVVYHPERFKEPYRWRKPQRVFVCSMGDLFHERVNIYGIEIRSIFRTMSACFDHTFMILTKRPDRMKLAIENLYDTEDVFDNIPNVWLGVSAENQEQANKRIPILLDTPAAKRFVSVEPMLGPIKIDQFLPPLAINNNNYLPPLDWVICGCESGPGARPMQKAWAVNILNQCLWNKVPFFYKQGPDENDSFVDMPRLGGIVWDQVPE